MCKQLSYSITKHIHYWLNYNQDTSRWPPVLVPAATASCIFYTTEIHMVLNSKCDEGWLIEEELHGVFNFWKWTNKSFHILKARVWSYAGAISPQKKEAISDHNSIDHHVFTKKQDQTKNSSIPVMQIATRCFKRLEEQAE